ncbi:MAG: hypothetical protein D6786_01710 [Gammaproteobacteria bacterium]|nr:MAG: hypothetical protein D6786_01710 [Gammaproteobacteria bacterium]
MKRTALLPALVLILAACGDQAGRKEQKDLVREASALFSQCRFEETTVTADRAIALGMADPQAYSFALMLKARSLDLLARPAEANRIYDQLVELAQDVDTAGKARKVARSLDVMLERCAANPGQDGPAETGEPTG